MRNNGIDKLALLVVLCAAALVVLVAAGTSPAYSADSRTEPVEIQALTAPEISSGEVPPTDTQPEIAAAESQDQAQASESDGYEWSGSRPADQRYLWSHRPN